MYAAVLLAGWLPACSPLRHAPTRAHAPRLDASTSSNDGAEIPFDVHFLRSAKAALRSALQQEGGVLDEDGLACVAALAVANPTLPNPSADDDLWADGSFSLLSGAISSMTSGRVVLRGAGEVKVDNLGGFEVSTTLGLTTDANGEATASLSAVGAATAVDDAELEVRCDQLTLAVDNVAGASPDELANLISTCAEATGLEFERPSSTAPLTWAAIEATLPAAARLRQLYLDQDCHILVRLEDSSEDEVAEGDAARVLGQKQQPIVLFAV